MTTLADRLAVLRAANPGELISHVDDPVVIGVGWSVHELAPADSDYWPRGGVVVHVDVAPDPTTGEVGDRYLVVRADKGRLTWVSLRADRLDGRAKRPNAHTIRGVCQVAGRELAASKRAPDDVRDLELFSLGARLMATLVRPDSGGPPTGAG